MTAGAPPDRTSTPPPEKETSTVAVGVHVVRDARRGGEARDEVSVPMSDGEHLGAVGAEGRRHRIAGGHRSSAHQVVRGADGQAIDGVVAEARGVQLVTARAK